MIDSTAIAAAFSPTLKFIVGTYKILFHRNYAATDQLDQAIQTLGERITDEISAVYSRIFDASMNSARQFFYEATKISNAEYKKHYFMSGVTELIRASNICELQSSTEEKYLQLTNVALCVSIISYRIGSSSSSEWLQKASKNYNTYMDKNIQNYRNKIDCVSYLKQISSSYIEEYETDYFIPHSNWAGGGGFYSTTKHEKISSSGKKYVERKIEERKKELQSISSLLFP